ncbi:hypothetical protein A3Q34_12690 [Colwellia sp. PAMC 20917]|uniref:Lcl C-terminal domain-containing protein n=1 Tax=Colwellia sp. PAMC 20917 TaxID=1816218 RepID=UPI000878C3BB|nr:DUF1566 domain-containing protein [Colwellia sp. PAMC 20917]AOW77633.1 hypothetical protein A3Q34_12690 [Colwellia sp. PAMC 20917]
MKKLLILISVAFISSVQAAHTCNDNITKSTPTARFTDNADGTVTDTVTDLTWMRCTLGESWDGANCTGAAQTYDWQEALTEADSSNLATHTNWRLPNIKEMQSIVEYACYDPAFNVSVFPESSNSNPQYWSSSIYSKTNYHSAWALSQASGSISDEVKSNSKLVRLVRD